jgi:hypothetical protein
MAATRRGTRSALGSACRGCLILLRAASNGLFRSSACSCGLCTAHAPGTPLHALLRALLLDDLYRILRARACWGLSQCVHVSVSVSVST